MLPPTTAPRSQPPITVRRGTRRANVGSRSSAAARLVSGPTATSSGASSSRNSRNSASTAGSPAIASRVSSRMPAPSWPNQANPPGDASDSAQPGCTGMSLRPASASSRAAIRARTVVSPATVVTATSSSSGEASASASASASSTSVPMSVSSTIRRAIGCLYAGAAMPATTIAVRTIVRDRSRDPGGGRLGGDRLEHTVVVLAVVGHADQPLLCRGEQRRADGGVDGAGVSAPRGGPHRGYGAAPLPGGSSGTPTT
jgi:hypothetical protein